MKPFIEGKACQILQTQQAVTNIDNVCLYCLQFCELLSEEMQIS